MAYSPTARIMFDVGDVLSIRSSKRYEIMGYVAPGAYACLVLAVWRYGPDSICVVSRTNTASWTSTYRGQEQDHWVVKFLKAIGLFDLGVPEANVLFCKQKYGNDGKGWPSSQLNVKVFVDNDVDCARDIIENGSLRDSYADANSYWIHFDNRNDGQKPDMPWMNRRVTTFWKPASDFHEIASMLGLLEGIPEYVWGKLCSLGITTPA